MGIELYSGNEVLASRFVQVLRFARASHSVWTLMSTVCTVYRDRAWFAGSVLYRRSSLFQR